MIQLYYGITELDGMNIWQRIDLDDSKESLVWEMKIVIGSSKLFFDIDTKKLTGILKYYYEIPYFLLTKEGKLKVNDVKLEDGKIYLTTPESTITIDTCLSRQEIVIRYKNSTETIPVHLRMVNEE